MIKGGLYNYLINAPSITSLLTPGQAGNSIHFSSAPKQPLTPFIVIHLPSVPPAEQTLDSASALIEGLIQFDVFASDIANGAQSASQLVRALKNLFVGLNTTFNDGTTIQFVEVVIDADDGYEEGGQSFLFRSYIRFKAFYTEGP